jgi:uncharacterized protein YjbI with pentapeptide repeats
MSSESTSTDQAEGYTRTSRIVRWTLVVAALVLVAEVVGGILYLGEMTKPWWEGAHNKRFWSYLDLLIVPAAIAIGVTVLNLMQNERTRKAEDVQQERELAVENQRAQDEALQAYLDQMSQLVIDQKRPLRRARPGDDLSAVARARSLTALTRLDASRKRSVLQFLYESGLITKGQVVVDLRQADLSAASLGAADLHTAYLGEANLREADLHATDLREVDLSDVDLSEGDLSSANLHRALLRGAELRGTDLRVANLREADLKDADLRRADLSTANLHTANLSGADLRDANLREADLRESNPLGAYLSAVNLHTANLSGADVRDANLREADLREADLEATNLSGADLTEANLSAAILYGAILSEADLRGADLRDAILTNATMPNGQNYEEWLETPEGQQGLETYKEGRGEDSGLS